MWSVVGLVGAGWGRDTEVESADCPGAEHVWLLRWRGGMSWTPHCSVPTDVEWGLCTTIGGSETRTAYVTGADGTAKESSLTTGSSAIAEPSANCSNSRSLDPISKGGHFSTPKWQRAQSQAEVRNRQPLPSPKVSSNTSTATRPTEKGVQVSRQVANPLAKSAQTGPDGSSIESRRV